MGLVSEFIEAANYTAGRPGGAPLGIVIHDEEFPEKVTSAEDVAGFFHNQPKNRESDSSVDNPVVDSGGSSAHYTHDSDSTVQCVRDGDTAWDAPPNTEWPHLGFEHDGFAKQTREEWLDDHGRRMLRRSARLAAKKSAKYGIPVRRLTVDELRGKRKGFVGHRDVSEAFGISQHSDPGEQFPWGWYLTRVRRYRWRYFVFRITANGKLIAKSDAAREDKTAVALKRLVADNAAKIASEGKAIITRKRVF